MADTNELLERLVKQVEELNQILQRSPWSFPYTDKWIYHSKTETSKTIGAGQRFEMLDIKMSGWLVALYIISNSPKVRGVIELYTPTGVVRWSATMEELFTQGGLRPTGHAMPYITVYDEENDYYSAAMTPPYPGFPFRGRVHGYVKNENTTDILLYRYDIALFEVVE